jgi:transcriptional regulator
MYQPPQFSTQDPAHALRIMRDYPFATLISTDDQGFPFVTHLPLHLEQRHSPDAAKPQWRLLGHVAKPNAHWRYLQARPKALVSFVGPYAYLSPQIYPDLARVPSWNYLTVQAVVSAQLIEVPEDKDQLLKKLIGDHEARYAQQWIDLGKDYQHKMLAGIVGFKLRIEKLDCKLKLNQHRPESHAKLYEMYSRGGEKERALAQWMRDLGLC